MLNSPFLLFIYNGYSHVVTHPSIHPSIINYVLFVPKHEQQKEIKEYHLHGQNLGGFVSSWVVR
jgi:hypothetical protein